MKSKLSLLMAVVLIAFASTQCRKKTTEETAAEEPTPTGPATTFTAISQVLASLGSQNQTFTVSASSASTLNVNGVLVEIPANSFIDPSTSLPATGNVTVTAKTILTKSQIIFSGAAANSTSSRLISTKGCVKVTASQNTQSLRVGSGGTVTVNIPDPSGSIPMKKYYAPKITATDSTIVWELGTDVNDIPMGNIGSVNHHRAALDSLKWLNVGVMWDSLTSNKSAIILNTDTIFNNTNSVFYLSLNGSLTVGSFYQLLPGKFRIANIPNGRGVHVIGFGVKNGQYYSGIMSILTTAAAVNLTMVPKSLSQIQAEIAAIP
ncbi:MAG: hypothetical protein IPJ32_09510 [Sphingobacteriaceae bacterium]|nr:hypothetical protein [Sphingobacteriaceae bacterium]